MLIYILGSTFMLLWITSKVESGKLNDEAEAKNLYQGLVIVSALFTVPAGFCFGKFADNFPAQITLPTVFGLRAVSMFAFYPLEDPKSFFTLGIMTLMIVSAIGENVCLSAYFSRNLPKNIRGTLLGVNTALGTIGMFFFSLVGGNLYDKVSKKAPFLLVGAFDSLFLLILLVLAACGKLKEGSTVLSS